MDFASSGKPPAFCVYISFYGIGRSLADFPPVKIDAAHAARGREGDKAGSQSLDVALTDAVFLLCQDDDASSLRRLVSQGCELGRIRQPLCRCPFHGQKFNRLAVAQRNRAGLVEQKDVHVAGGFDGLARHGNDVRLDHTVHAGDADGGEQAADGGRNKADEEGDDHRHGDRRSLPRRPDAVDRKGHKGHGGQKKDQREPGKQDVEGDLVRRFLALGPLHHGDHLVEERLARVCRDADDEPVRQHTGAAGYGASVAAAFPDHRGALPRDGALIDGCDADGHLPVSGNGISGFHKNEIPLLELRTGDDAGRGIPIRFLKKLGHNVPPRAFQRSCLGLAPSFGQGFGEVGEQQGEPQPETDGHDERGSLLAMAGKGLEKEQRRQDAADLHDKHHRVLNKVQGIQLDEGIDERPAGVSVCQEARRILPLRS